MMTRFSTRVLNPGFTRGELVVLDDALSFWGGFDPNSGKVIDAHHPQFGMCVEGKILVLPSSRGSAGTPAGIAEAVRQKTAPKGIVLGQDDVNIAMGMMVAKKLYQVAVPVVVLDDPESYMTLDTGDEWTISDDGTLIKE